MTSTNFEDRIGRTLVAAVKPVVPLSLYEAETGAYPYAVYEHSPEYHRTKDGVYKIVSSVPVTVYGKSYADTRPLADRVEAAALEAMNGGAFRAVTVSRADTCVEGIWRSEVRLQITQYNQ